MATVKQHYDEVLSDVYSWMFGGFESGIQRNVEFFNKLQLAPKGSGVAVDLGAGCGFQSIPLAKAGYSVTAFDLDSKLLSELNSNAENLPINKTLFIGLSCLSMFTVYPRPIHHHKTDLHQTYYLEPDQPRK